MASLTGMGVWVEKEPAAGAGSPPAGEGTAGRMRPLYIVWAAVLLGAVVLLVVQSADPAVLRGLGSAAEAFLTWASLALVVLALVCEFVDASLGMGYGTTLTPVLLLLGFQPLEIVPAVLLSQLLSGITGGLLHHGAGNVSFRRGSRHLHVAGVLVACSVVGAWPAALVAAQVPTWALKAGIGVLVLGVGVVMMATLGRTCTFSWPRIAGLGLVAAFSKAVSGGGYGPIVVGGQVVCGLEPKSAVGITSLAEGITCTVGVAAYALTTGIDARVALPLVIGAMVSVPLAVQSVKAVPTKGLRVAIGLLTLVLGGATLLKLAL